MPRKLRDLVGEKFGRLTVIARAGMVKNGEQRQSAWSCKCTCGQKTVVSNSNLRGGKVLSCGCLQTERAKTCNLQDMNGLVFGMLTVLEYAESRCGNAYWLCHCECGRRATVAACALKKGQQSCGCRQGNFVHGEWSKGRANYKKYRRQDAIYNLKHSVSRSVRSAIKSKGGSKAGQRTFDFLPYTAEELKQHLESQFEPWMNWNNYGGKSNELRKTWHIHHIKAHKFFGYKSLDDPLFRECWALDNLTPMEKLENIKLGARE